MKEDEKNPGKRTSEIWEELERSDRSPLSCWADGGSKGIGGG